MRTIGRLTFPENEAEADNWKPFQSRAMLHRQVMVIARTRIEGSWKAYCFPVAGEKHDDEEALWKTEGVAVYEPLARVMFPQFKDIPYDN